MRLDQGCHDETKVLTESIEYFMNACSDHDIFVNLYAKGCSRILKENARDPAAHELQIFLGTNPVAGLATVASIRGGDLV